MTEEELIQLHREIWRDEIPPDYNAVFKLFDEATHEFNKFFSDEVASYVFISRVKSACIYESFMKSARADSNIITGVEWLCRVFYSLGFGVGREFEKRSLEGMPKP